MMYEAVMGYPEDVTYCPFCGEELSSHYADGKHECEQCGGKFYVIEADDSER